MSSKSGNDPSLTTIKNLGPLYNSVVLAWDSSVVHTRYSETGSRTYGLTHERLTCRPMNWNIIMYKSKFDQSVRVLIEIQYSP